MFGPIRPTPYDVEFRMFGIPVRVLPWFWLMAAILGMRILNPEPGQVGGPLYMAIWMLVVFVSILVHELGHALTAEAFGCPSSILLYHFGGLAFHHPGARYSRLHRILITAAGPAAGLSLFGLVMLFLWCESQFQFLPPDVLASPVFYSTINFLIFVNLFWSLLNLLPVIPLDGGQLCREICMHFSRFHGEQIAWWISMTSAIVAAIGLAMYLRAPFASLMFAFLAYQSFEQLQRR